MEPFDFFDAYTEERFQFSAKESELLLDGCDTFFLKKGDVVYNAGKTSQIYYLRSGKVKHHMIYPDGSSRTTAYSKAPHFLGILSMMSGHDMVNYCTAVTRCEITVCPTELFIKRLREYDMMEKMLMVTIGVARHAYSNLTTLLANDRLRLVDVLRNEKKFTLQETADFIGCSRVQVSRIYRQLKENSENPE